MPRAAIDIGTNSILLTVVDDGGAVLADEAEVVGLGRGLGDRGLLAPDRMEAAEEVLHRYMALAKEHGVEPWGVKAVATSGARRAINAQTWVSRLMRSHSLRVRIITGEEEARLTWLGGLQGLDVPDVPVLMVDLGGGSTELALGQGDALHGRRSLEIGSVRLTEKYLGDGPVKTADLTDLRAHIQTEFAALSFRPAPEVIVGVAGTVTTFTAMALGLEAFDAAQVHGTPLTRAQLEAFSEELAPMSDEQRRARVPVAPARAPYLVAGAEILAGILGALGHEALVTSIRGVRYGLLVG